MKKAAMALATAAVVGFTALAAPSPAEAHWRGRGFGPGLAGGLIAACPGAGQKRPPRGPESRPGAARSEVAMSGAGGQW